jgi:hypothetical protein
MIQKILYILIGCLVLLGVASPFLIKVKVECKNQFGYCSDEFNSELSKQNGKSLFQARAGASKFLKGNIQVSDFSMQFKVPNVLSIGLLIKKPEFAIHDKASGKYGLVSNEGKIISVVESSSLPTVSVSAKEIKIGDTVSKQEIFALELMRGIWQMYQVGMGEIQAESLVVELPGSIRVILPLDGDLQVLLGEIRLVYGKIEDPNSEDKYSEIDLRFKNPVLR